MTTPPQATAPRRHVWRWVLLLAGICLTPFVLVGVAALSYLTLDSDAAVLRKHVMAATDAGWHTKIQMSVGGMSLGAVRSGLHFVHPKENDRANFDEARMALGAIRHASVGVYERTSGSDTWSRTELFAETDRVMARRGWTRLVGVADNKDTVLIYISGDMDTDGPVDLCLAVVSGKELVVVSTSVNPSVLAELVHKHAGDDLKGHLRLAKFKF